ncbi:MULTISPECIES: efflux transporter outer membrane subunit [Methylobacterium]|nr:efflux transporter outer membrane subunit [Methylobacterium organophilum]KOX60247.1 histidine kinase [Streptomyces purpurogeneiscleroticus]MWV25156.1 efflux transporter outer membrane subunit [Methylobacterium sp. 2A]OXE39171.1 histidine kinase [Methylobacterium radiotolerans]RUP23399.1 MAG: efflux transporter outer membrane subunit [Methylobacterium sp.]MBN6822388.1 efflux transporter outer membrane subunit [Methylobacterium organophilum]
MALGRLSRYGGVILLAWSVAACAVGPNFMPPEDPPVSRYTREPLKNPSAADKIRTRQGGSADQSFASGADIPGQWWTLFHSKALNRLVEQALANNPTLEAAQASLRVAQQNALAQKGTLYPSLTATPQAEGIQAPGLDLQSPLQNQTQYLYSLFTPQAVVSYNPDVFGGNRRQIESLEAATENQRFQLEAAYLSLTANVVAAAIQEASLRAQIDATQKVIQAQIEVLQLYNKQLSLGQIAGADVVQQQAALALSQQLLPPLEKALAQQRNLLTALAGRLPSDEVPETFRLSALRLPTRLPVSLPSRLVQQRPDVKAAEAMVQQASASVGVAVANRLPQFTLTATGGSSATQITQITNPAASFFTIVGQATAPIFDAGTLFRRQRAAEEGLTQAQAQYRATVITAFQNVADALRALQADARAVAAADAAVNATNQSLELVRKQFTAGSVTSTQVLIAQQGYLSALVTAAGARATQYADTAALFVALGGGWWNRADVAPPPPEKDPLKFL